MTSFWQVCGRVHGSAVWVQGPGRVLPAGAGEGAPWDGVHRWRGDRRLRLRLRHPLRYVCHHAEGQGQAMQVSSFLIRASFLYCECVCLSVRSRTRMIVSGRGDACRKWGWCSRRRATTAASRISRDLAHAAILPPRWRRQHCALRRKQIYQTVHTNNWTYLDRF